MVEKAVTRVMRKRHYWRYIDFAELAELYASRILRVTAISLISSFVAIYLYKNGYSLTFIAGYFALLFTTRGLFAVPSAFIIGRIGPKHATLLSNITYVPAMLALSSLEKYGIVALGITLLFQAFSASIYNIAYQVDFSKVRHRDHAGKEIGYMVALERIAMALSPLIGGVTASIFGAQATIILAASLFGVAALPLLLTSEPVRTHQHISFRGMKWAKLEHSLVAQFGIGWDYVSSGIYWTLFVSITVFGAQGDGVYAKLGFVTALSVIVAVITSRIYGIIIDQKRGNYLLHFGVFGAAILNLLRPAVSTTVGVVGVNITNEVTKTAYGMPFTKGIFDEADDTPRYRIAYLACQDMGTCSGMVVSLLSLIVLSSVYSETLSLRLMFCLSALMILLVVGHKFKALHINEPRIVKLLPARHAAHF